MPKIFINRNRQNLGQFSDEEVAEGLRTGRFSPSDLAWQEPMETWQPLSTFQNLSGGQAAASPSPEAVGTPGGISSEAPAVFSSVVEPAWERTGESRAGAMFATVRDVFSKPTDVFRAMPTIGGYGRPLSFYVLFCWLTGAVTLLYQGAIAYVNPTMMLGEAAKNFKPEMLVVFFGAGIVLLPVFLAIGVFVSAAVMHVALMMVGGGRNGYEATFRALSYASGSASLLQVIPICGSWVYGIVSLVYSVIALKEAHRTDLWRPVVAVVIVLLVCCGFGMLVVGGLGAAAAAAAQAVK